MRCEVIRKEYVEILPDSTSYPKVLEDHAIYTLDANSNLSDGIVETQYASFVVNGVGTPTTESATTTVAYSTHFRPSNVTAYSHPDQSPRGVCYQWRYSRAFVSIEKSIASTKGELLSYAISQYNAGTPIKILYHPYVPNDTAWKAVKKMSTNQFGYLNEETGEFMETYGLTGELSESEFILQPVTPCEVVKSKNLLDEATISKKGIYLDGGRVGEDWVVVSNNNDFSTDNIPIKPNTDYTITKSSADRFAVALTNKSTTKVGDTVHIVFNSRTATQCTFNSGSYSYVVATLYRNTPIEFAMLNEGSTALPYEPYGLVLQPVESKEVAKGKNLFDKNADGIEVGLLDKDGVVQSSFTSWSVSDFIKVKPNTEYCFTTNSYGSANTVNSAYYDSNKNLISVLHQQQLHMATPNNCYYVRVSIFRSSLDITQFEEGSQATTYEPYGLVLQ